MKTARDYLDREDRERQRLAWPNWRLLTQAERSDAYQKIRKYMRTAEASARKATFDIFEAYATAHWRVCGEKDNFLELLPLIAAAARGDIVSTELTHTDVARVIGEAIGSKKIEWTERIEREKDIGRQHAVEARPKPSDVALGSARHETPPQGIITANGGKDPEHGTVLDYANGAATPEAGRGESSTAAKTSESGRNPLSAGPEGGARPGEQTKESVDQRAKRRCAVVMPILCSKGWSRCKWATRAGVSKNSVYEYLSGDRELSTANRVALAQELGVKDLPE